MNIFERFNNWVNGTPPPAAKAFTLPAWAMTGNGFEVADRDTFGNNENGWLAAYRGNVWAYNCIQARMSAFAQAPMKLYKPLPDGQKEELFDHPIQQILRDINPYTLNRRSFRRSAQQQRALFGRCLIYKVRGTQLTELYILPKNFVEIIPSETEYIAGYKWTPTGREFSREDIIDWFYPLPDGSVDADSPTAVAVGAINRYNLADKAQESIDKRGGQKGGLVVHPEDEIEIDFRRMSDEWDKKRGNVNNAGRDMHVPYGTNYLGDAFSATEMDREMRNMRLAKEIMAAYSIPPAVAGDYSDASVLANAATQFRSFWETWAAHELADFAEELTINLLHAEYPESRDAGLFFEHDLSGIPALREDADARANRAVVLVTGGIASINEGREMNGLDPVDDPAADVVTKMQLADAQPEQPAAPAQPEPADDEPAKAFPIVDYVGRMAVDLKGAELGKIEKLHRQGDHEGLRATPDKPVVVIGGKVYQSDDVRVRYG
jgi:HK97 family phage portal protein